MNSRIPDPNNTSVPIPNKIPEILEPSMNQTSSVVNTLIQQNLDLTTRLTIQLRRIADFENTIQQIKKQHDSMSAQKETLIEELQIQLKRNSHIEASLLQSKHSQEKAEKGFAALQFSYSDDRGEWEEKLHFVSNKLTRLQEYRRRIHQYIAPLFKKLKADALENIQLHRRIKRFQKYRTKMKFVIRPWVRELKDKVRFFEQRTERLEQKNADMSERLTQMIQHLREKERGYEADQKSLVDYHEKKYFEAGRELEMARKQASEAEAKVVDYKASSEKYFEQSVKNENRAVHAERDLSLIKNTQTEDIKKLRTERDELQRLLTKTRLDFESYQVQTDAASHLNKKLNLELSALRKENEKLRLRIRQQKQIQIVPTVDITPKPEQESVEELLEPGGRIEDLLHEIQSGHSKKSQQQVLESEAGDLEDLV